MRGKYAFIIRRAVLTVPLVLIVASLLFFLFQVLPGDTALVVTGVEGSPQELAAVRERLGLNLPAYQRYVIWLSDLLRGNLGTSLRTSQTASGLSVQVLPATLGL